MKDRFEEDVANCRHWIHVAEEAIGAEVGAIDEALYYPLVGQVAGALMQERAMINLETAIINLQHAID